MTSERSEAYVRLGSLLAEPVLRDDERARVRRAADALVLARGRLDVEGLEARSEAYAVAYELMASRRWPGELSQELIASLEACGPGDEPTSPLPPERTATAPRSAPSFAAALIGITWMAALLLGFLDASGLT